MIQSEALKLMVQGHNVFLTGAPGSGKSFVIEQFVSLVRSSGKEVALTATTGIAAYLIGGITIHSWAQLIPRPEMSTLRAPSDELIERLMTTDVLIIDEISMLCASDLIGLDSKLKSIRADSRSFGGLQVIFSGDFFQLPPIKKDGVIKYAFETEIWQELGLVNCYLTEQHRQTADELLDILSALRSKQFSRQHLNMLMQRQLTVEDSDALLLMTHNREVEKLNLQRLDRLPGYPIRFDAVIRGNSVATRLLKQSMFVAEVIWLKRDAKVMFIANNLNAGYVNGSQGTVIGFRGGLPLVELDDTKLRIRVEPYTWRYELSAKLQAEISQLPLKLAWAVTIHKSQGMSISDAVIDLTRSFTYGMGYVALSRLRSYKGLYLKGLNSRSLQLDPKVYDFDENCRVESEYSTVNDSDQRQSDKGIDALRLAGADERFIQMYLGVSAKELKSENKRIRN